MSDPVLPQLPTSQNAPAVKICEDCEIENGSVKWRVDPYIEDIYGERVEKWMCDKCYIQACEDI